MFIGAYQNAVSGLTCTWLAYFVPISPSRSAGGASSVQSAWPFSIAVICASTVRPNDYDDLVRVAVGLRGLSTTA